jgi:hypothetical protein
LEKHLSQHEDAQIEATTSASAKIAEAYRHSVVICDLIDSRSNKKSPAEEARLLWKTHRLPLM